MATRTAVPTQITTADVDPATAPPSSAPGPVAPAASVPASPVGHAHAPAPDSLLETPEQEAGTGVEGESTIWEARYAMKNFLGRLIGMGILTVAWIILAGYVWGHLEQPGAGWQFLAILSGIVLLLLWLALGRRIILARYGHYYRLTNRRLFVSTGMFRRRRDQMELLKVQDVFTRQTFFGRMLSLGTVVVVSSEANYPVMYLTGVEDPKAVMDLVWHQARTERDRRTVKIDHV